MKIPLESILQVACSPGDRVDAGALRCLRAPGSKMRVVPLAVLVVSWCAAFHAPCRRGVWPRQRLLARRLPTDELVKSLESKVAAFKRARLGNVTAPAPVDPAVRRRRMREQLRRTKTVARLFLGQQFERNVFALFDAADVNEDGRLSLEEA